MRIGFFNCYEIWGGGEKWHLEMALFCKQKGDDVTILSPSTGELAKRGLRHHVPIEDIQFKKSGYFNPVYLYKLWIKLRNLQLDVLVFNSFQDVRFAALVAKLAKVKVTFLRGGLPTLPKKSLSYYLAFRYGLDCFVANCLDTQLSFAQSGLLRSWQILPFITNGIDIERFAPPLNKQKAEIFKLGNAVRLSHAKGIDLLIEIVGLIKQKCSKPFVVEIAGRGELEEEMKKLVEQRNLSDIIHFIGHVENIAPFLAQLDIALFTSRYEGASNTIIEMMGCALPIVAFDTSSMHDMLEHQETALLAPAFDCDNYAQQVVLLLQDRELCKRLGNKARKLVECEYNAQINFGRWYKLFMGKVC